MCRSIVQLRRPERDVTETEIAAAARQFVRKVSGYRVPSKANTEPFETAVAEVSAATRRLLAALDALPSDPGAQEAA
jgi:hypothetical protein